jgi:uncharacterized protein (TIGR02145 family)
MRTISLFIVSSLLLVINIYAQKPTMELTFTAINNTSYAQLDSIKVMNRTQWCDILLYWPDTILELEYHVGIQENITSRKAIKIFQNYPNPVENHTTISLYIPEKDEVCILITDILGKEIISMKKMFKRGYHSFKFFPGNSNIYFCTAKWHGESNTIKIINSQSDNPQKILLEYLGSDLSMAHLKTLQVDRSFVYNYGDELLYIVYIDTLQSGILDTPETSNTYTFQFATNIPCPGTPTITYEGQVYNTIQIFSQCWLRENLNIGKMISGTEDQQNNDTIEKYCYNNELDSCTKYGGLYQWDEVMQYSIVASSQGICPSGWHIPSDKEWKVLEGSVDSQYGIGDPIWHYLGYRGLDAGANLKTTSGWKNEGNGTDLFGFSGLPGGFRDDNSSFDEVCEFGRWWSSTVYYLNDWAWYRNLYYYYPKVWRDLEFKKLGYSVRCLKN